jgi:hypothetical protein
MRPRISHKTVYSVALDREANPKQKKVMPKFIDADDIINQFLLSGPGFLISNLSDSLLSDSILIRALYSPL